MVRRICSLLRTAGTADPGPGLDTPEQQLLLVTRGIHCNASHGLFLSRAELLAVGGIVSPAKGRWIRRCPPSGAATNRRDQSHPERAGRPSLSSAPSDLGRLKPSTQLNCYGVMPHPEEAGLQKAGPSPDCELTA